MFTQFLLITVAVLIAATYYLKFMVNIHFNKQADKLRDGDDLGAIEHEYAWHRWNEAALMTTFASAAIVFLLIGIPIHVTAGISGILWVLNTFWLHYSRKDGMFEQMTSWERLIHFGDGKGNFIENFTTRVQMTLSWVTNTYVTYILSGLIVRAMVILGSILVMLGYANDLLWWLFSLLPDSISAPIADFILKTLQ